MSREMKDSGIKWIGDIPKHWKVPKMNYICNTITDFVASGSFESLRINVPYLDSPDYAMLVRTTDLSGSARSEKRVYISKHSYDFLRNSNLFGGEIILPNIGAVGDVYIVPKGMYEKMSLAPNAIMFKSNYLDKFYFYYFYCMAGRQSILELCQSTAQAKFNKTQLRSVRVLLPPLAEQQKIADYLDKVCGEVDAMIALQEKMIEELKAYKQSVITEAVTKGLNPNVPMRDSGIDWIGDIPEHWSLHQFKRIFEIKKIIAKTLGYDVLSVTQNGIKVKDLSKNEGQIAQDYSKYQLVNINDFVMNHMDLLTGFVDCSNQEGVTSPDYRVFRALKKNQLSLSYYLRIFQTCYKERIFYHLGQGVSGMGRWRLPAEQLKLFVLPMPPLCEQQQIASHLDTICSEIDSLIAIKQKKIEELKDYKKSIIYEYVTGKKQVN